MYDASCEAKNATVAATSSGCPNRFIGTFATTSFANSSMASFGSPVFPKIGVTIGPGATVFTRMPRPTSSAAAVLARERSAALVAEYALVPALTCAVCHAGIQDDRRTVIQQRQRFLDREVRSLDVDVKLLVVKAFGCLGQWRELRDSRVDEQHVNLTQLPRNLSRTACPLR